MILLDLIHLRLHGTKQIRHFLALYPHNITPENEGENEGEWAWGLKILRLKSFDEG